MRPAEVVGAPDQIHPRGQGLHLVGDGPTPPHQRGERAPEGRIEPFDVGGVDPVPRARRLQDRRDRVRGPLHDALRHADAPPLRAALDHLAEQEARRQHQPGPAAPPRVDRRAEHPPEGRDGAGQAIDTDEEVPPAGAGPDLLPQAGDEDPIPVRADRPAQPQAGWDGQRQGHPDPLAHALHPQFIGLDVLQIAVSLLHQVCVHLLAVAPRPGEPPGHRAFIQAKRGDNSLRRAALAQQGEHHRHQVGRAAQPVEGRARRGRKGAPARVTHIPVFRLAMHPDVALPHLASGRAVHVVTELLPRVHAATPARRVSETRQPEHASADPPLPPDPG